MIKSGYATVQTVAKPDKLQIESSSVCEWNNAASLSHRSLLSESSSWSLILLNAQLNYFSLLQSPQHVPETVQDTWRTHSAQDKRANRYQKQCRIHGQFIQHRTNEPIGTRNSVGYMVNPCSTGNCCLHTMCQVPKKCMKCYVVCKICILQLKKYRKFYFSSSVTIEIPYNY